VAAAAGDTGPRLGDGRRREEQRRARRPRRGEAEVLDGGVEQGMVGGLRRRVDDPGRVGGGRGDAGDAAEEALAEGGAGDVVFLLLRGTGRGCEEQKEEEREEPESWLHHRLRLAAGLAFFHLQLQCSCCG